MKLIKLSSIILCAALVLSGCGTIGKMNNTAKGGVIGGAGGAGVGALIGGLIGKGKGAAIGAGVGWSRCAYRQKNG